MSKTVDLEGKTAGRRRRRHRHRRHVAFAATTTVTAARQPAITLLILDTGELKNKINIIRAAVILNCNGSYYKRKRYYYLLTYFICY